uniref:ribosomal protein S3 n=1 Tax=Magnusiomyces fungicola TaxID=1734004 RepID=UPI001BEF68F0|nr:ribosomal protein S3 [Saprochaete fungicola]QUV75094.1 ribosomal protein S3 [Saprochaete fungicola]
MKSLTKSITTETTSTRTQETQGASHSISDVSTSRTHRYNISNDNKHNTYRFHGRGAMDAVTRNNTTDGTTRRFFQSKTVSRGSAVGQIVRHHTSTPIFKDTPGQTRVVVFVYQPGASKTTTEGPNQTTTIRMTNNVSQGATSTNGTFSDETGKSVSIEPVVTKYDYFHSDIFANSTGENIHRFTTYKKGYTRATNQITTQNAPTTETSSKWRRDDTQRVRRNDTLAATTTGERQGHTDRGHVIWNTLNNKYTIGFSFEFAGKTPKTASTARTTRDARFRGTTQRHTDQSVPFRTNRIANITQAQRSQINKNGKYNVRIQTGHL